MIDRRVTLGYGVGDLANNLLFQLSVLYLLFFYTDVAGIAPGAVGVIFVVARVWDAVNDPIMGIMVDRTHSRHGRARVYLRYASLPLAAATVLLFWAPELRGGLSVAYAAVTYVIWGMLYTMISIPYASMTAELTDDPEERTRLSSVRMIFMLIGVIVVSVATEPLSSMFASRRTGYVTVAATFAVLAFVLFQVCFAATGRAATGRAAGRSPGAEEPGSAAAARQTLRASFGVVVRNRPLMILTAAFLIGATAEYMREATIIYFVTYNMGRGGLLPLVMAVVVVAMIGGNLLIPTVARRLDKRGTFVAGTTVGVAGSIAFHLVPHTSVVAVLATAAVSSIGFTVVSTLGWAMLPDTVEYGEYVTGTRSEGVIYAVFSFSQKLATALAGGLVALILHITAYVPNAARQTDEALRGILGTITVVPAILITVSALILVFYPLDRDRFARIRGELRTRGAEARPENA